MERGTVIWFDVGKGYGYIRRDGGLPDLLVTLCAVERAGMASLTKGQRLSFEDAYDNRIERACADNISKVLDPSIGGYRGGSPWGRSSRRAMDAERRER